jgi:hypothetical protein
MTICKDIIEAVQAYTDTFGHNKPSGYMLTSALVESIYWVEFERQKSPPVLEEAVLAKLRLLAANLLHDLALDIGSAARAYGSLGDILSSEFAALASQEIDSVSQNPDKSQSSQSYLQSIGLSSSDSLESLMSFDLDDTTGLMPVFDRIPGSIAPHSRSAEDAFDVAPNIDWNTLINSLSSAGYSDSDLQFGEDA